MVFQETIEQLILQTAVVKSCRGRIIIRIIFNLSRERREGSINLITWPHRYDAKTKKALRVLCRAGSEISPGEETEATHLNADL